MNRIIVDLNEPAATGGAASLPAFLEPEEAPQKRGTVARILKWLAAAAVVIALAVGIGGYFYWQSLKDEPQYSLALLIDSARRDDQAGTDRIVDIDAVVEDFLPQITGKAIELYGGGIPPKALARVEGLAKPLVPAIKDRARAELPGVIRDRTAKFANVPFAAVVLGADRYVDIALDGNTAVIKSKNDDRPLEINMRRSGDVWRVVSIKDDALATKIAQKIGQEIIAVSANGGINSAGRRLGIKNLQDIIKQAEEILR